MPPLNLNKQFGEDLDYGYMPHHEKMESLKRIFKRDFIDNPCIEFFGKKIHYVRGDSDEDRTFRHVIMNDENGKREYIDDKRAKRLHWVKTLLEKSQKSQGAKYWVFSHIHPKHGLRTYIYHRKVRHVVILEPIEDKQEYFFITAFHVSGSGIDEMKKKYDNRLSEIH